MTHPVFDAAFRAEFRQLVLWRRDVRRFRTDPVARERIDALWIANHALPRKQRLSAQRIFDLIKDEGYKGSLRAVSAYIHGRDR